MSRERIVVANSADGGFLYWLGKLYGFALLTTLVLGMVTGLAVFRYFARTTPPAPDLSRYDSVTPQTTRILAGDGSVLGELADEWREIVPYEKIPKALIQSVLAAEDHDFFEHGGIYFKGVARAAWRNLTSGEFTQGGSTITQQVAKLLLAGSEKTIARKIREAITARRLEARYSKTQILSVYLNHIFMGSGAYGVQAAAKRYFSKNVWELDVGEMALLAGLARSPSRDSPLVSLENAQKRRDFVLERLARYGWLSAAEAESWKHRPIVLHPYHDTFLTTEPYFAEHIRRLIATRFGADALMKRGLRVETTIQPVTDGMAYENVEFSTRKQDKRQGWRGPEAHLEGGARATFLARQKDRAYGQPMAEGKRYLALVDTVDAGGARVRIGEEAYQLPLRNLSWAAKWSKSDATNDARIDSATAALHAGDVVWVSRPLTHVRKFSDWTYDDKLNAFWTQPGDLKIKPDEVQLEQTPRVEGAILTMDHQSGYVVAMVGGESYERSEFNRAVQACRSPGSTYKPIYYSAALADGWSFDAMLDDQAKPEVDPVTGETWTPVDMNGSSDFHVSLEYALVFSKNIPSVEVFEKVGAKNVEAWARRLGFTSTIIADQALALGASCVYMPELTRAFAIFARNGRWLDPVYVRRVLDREGRVLEDNTVYYDEQLAPNARLDRLAALAGAEAGSTVKQAIPARSAYLTTKLLRSVVTDGYSGALREVGLPAAGKTGTSSATMDLWFVAFTSRWTTSMWLGDDLRERPLGKIDAAFMMATPVWARYMAEATQGQPLKELPTEAPAGSGPNDRGGSKGRSAEGGPPMPLVPHHGVRPAKDPDPTEPPAKT